MNLKISRILHAGYVFEYQGNQIAFDPIFENPFSKNCYAFPDVRFDLELIRNLDFAAVFISHYHDDHCSLESLNLLNRKTPIYVYCIFEELFLMIKELGFLYVYSLEIGISIQINSFCVTPHRALDADVDSLFQIQAGGLNVLNVVDSWIDDSTLIHLVQKAPWDLILWPFQTMREIEVLSPSRACSALSELPFEWLEQLEKLNPRYLVPSSCQFIHEKWSWYNSAFFPISYKQFEEQVKSLLPYAEVLRLNPSISVNLDKSSLVYSSPLNWVIPVGEQNIDYEYKKDLIVPSTAEISTHFAPLTETQKREVFDYCKTGLLEKFKSLETARDSYFHKPRLWQLSIFDHQGLVTNFRYIIFKTNIKITSNIDDRFSWLTEVPISKLYGALKNGESLTSMYMRINDCVFEADIEKEMELVDTFDDPLICCLFSGVFGAYQSAQLRKIKENQV